MAKRYKKKQFRKRKGMAYYNKKAQPYLATAGKALRIALATKALLNVEHKFQDKSVTSNPDNSGSTAKLFDPAQGTSVSNRGGDSVKLANLTFRAIMNKSGSATNTNLRVIVFRGNRENGTTPSVSALLQTTSVISPKNHDNRFDTKILFDRVFQMNDGATTMRQLNLNIKLGTHVNFSSGTTSIEDGGIYILLLSDQSTNTPQIKYYSRITYVDN